MPSRQITRADSAASEVNCHYHAVTALHINRRRVAMAPRSRDAAPIGHLLASAPAISRTVTRVWPWMSLTAATSVTETSQSRTWNGMVSRAGLPATRFGPRRVSTERLFVSAVRQCLYLSTERRDMDENVLLFLHGTHRRLPCWPIADIGVARILSEVHFSPKKVASFFALRPQ